MKAPCLNCKDRNICCHDTCERFMKYRNRVDRSRMNKEELEANDYLYAAMHRMKHSRVSK